MEIPVTVIVTVINIVLALLYALSENTSSVDVRLRMFSYMVKYRFNH